MVAVDIAAVAGSFHLEARFEAPAGITALFGPSGAGKTLTLRCVAGLTRPVAGRIEVGGRTLFDAGAGTDLPARDRRVGYVFQQYALFPHLSVAGNIAYGLHALPRARRRERAAELLEMVGLGGYGERSPTGLSGGQQQRVAIARALAYEPRILLLDEPFAALDAMVRVRLRAELRALHERTRIPMILVSHDLAEVRQLADHLVLFEEGRVLACGELAHVLRAPANDRAAALLAAAGA
jgi:molybdenum ABC transporter ATP-binding protein